MLIVPQGVRHLIASHAGHLVQKVALHSRDQRVATAGAQRPRVGECGAQHFRQLGIGVRRHVQPAARSDHDDVAEIRRRQAMQPSYHSRHLERAAVCIEVVAAVNWQLSALVHDGKVKAALERLADIVPVDEELG